MNERYQIIQGPEGEQGSPEWLAFRQGKVGGSDIAAIMGISPWETRRQCFDRFMTGINPRKKNSAMDRGNRLEPIARDCINKRLNRFYIPVVIQSDSHPDIICSLDGFDYSAERVHIMEIKWPNKATHEKAMNKEIEPYYYCQLQHAMDMVGVDSMIYGSFYSEDCSDAVIIEVKRDEEYCKKMFLEVLSFMASVFSCNPPESSDKDWVEEIDPILVSKASRCKEIQGIIKQLEEEDDILKTSIISSCSHPRTVLGDVKLQKVDREGGIDYKRFIEENNIDIPVAYKKKSTEYWKLS